jgi:hypothetical protein
MDVYESRTQSKDTGLIRGALEMLCFWVAADLRAANPNDVILQMPM